jgi:hypothetical protein
MIVKIRKLCKVAAGGNGPDKNAYIYDSHYDLVTYNIII